MHQAQWSPERPLPPPVSLASPSHHEKPPEVTCTSRGNPGFPASTRESPRETSFNTSRGQIPLPWLGSNDALPLATRMETRLPWRPTRVFLEDWAREHRRHFEVVRVIGKRWSRRCHELRDLLGRNGIPYGFYDVDSDEGRALLEQFQCQDQPLPV